MKCKNLKHGMARTSIYHTWRAMQDRCYNENLESFALWGGRGIKVCDRWTDQNGFENFLSDMGDKPSRHHSIDRIDNDGNYEPSNCRWATKKEQAENRRPTRFLDFNGIRLSISGWSERLGVHRDMIVGRLKLGWSIEDALTKPKRIH